MSHNRIGELLEAEPAIAEPQQEAQPENFLLFPAAQSMAWNTAMATQWLYQTALANAQAEAHSSRQDRAYRIFWN